MRILYISATLVPPPVDPQADRFFLLSENLEGDVLQPVWFRKPEDVEALYGPGSYPVYTVGRFRYHWFLAYRYEGRRQRLEILWFYLQKGRELYRERKFACIVAYSHMTTGLCAGLLKYLTGARLVIEIVTAPHLIYLTDQPRVTFSARLRHLYSDICLYLSTLMSDRLHLLTPDQLDHYRLLKRKKNTVFHEFVPISMIQRHADEERESDLFILLIGAPWYLKGVDLLIEAFLRLAPDFPEVKLKILGHFPDKHVLEAMAAGSPQIEIMRALLHHQALEVISKATILALPSRCEGLARVLIEGMAAGVPLVGSDVGGIPTILRHGENGFLIPVGDSHALESRLRQLLSDSEMRQRMGDRGYLMAHTELDEKVYVQQFSRMVEAAIEGHE